MAVPDQQTEVSVLLPSGRTLVVQCYANDRFLELQEKLQMQHRSTEGTYYRICRDTTIMKNVDYVLANGSSFSAAVVNFEVPTIGDELELIFPVDSARCGDKGRVSQEDALNQFEVTWYRSGKSTMARKEDWFKNFRLTENKVKLPCLGDEVQVLPGISFSHNGTNYYGQGDKGRVCKEQFVDVSDGIKRFEVTWYRTGLTSTMKSKLWLRNFQFIGKAAKEVPSLGDEVECLPAVTLTVEQKDYYRAGDRGRVSKDVYRSDKDNIERFEVTWYRTGLTSTMKANSWLKNFRLVAEGMRAPSLGDEVECLPMATLSVNEKDYYRAGDKGRVSKDVYRSEGDNIERFEVTWYRTGQTSTMKADAWLKNFRLVAEGMRVPSFGDEVECLPMAILSVNERDYYRAGDKGRVSKDVYRSEADNIERFEVTWYRTGLTSTMKNDSWLRNFRLIEECGITVPSLGDELEVLPGAHRTVDGTNYYGQGDRGTVSQGAYMDVDGKEKIEVMWERTELRSKEETACWLKQFKLIGVASQNSSFGAPQAKRRRMLTAGSTKEETNMHFVVIGQPGVGKSTILGGFFQSSDCEFGHTTGDGMTIKMTRVNHPTEPNFFGLDLPGLEDPSPTNRQQFAAELRTALSQKGSYQIVFVIKENAGRLDKSTVEMITRVLASVPVSQDQFGVIVNKIDEDTMAYLSENDRHAELTKSLNEIFKPRTAHVHFQEYNDGMSSRKLGKGHCATLPLKMIAFLKQLPIVYIDPEQVGELEDMSDIRVRKLMEEADRSKKLYRKQLEDLETKYRKVDSASSHAATQRHASIQLYTLGFVVPLNIFALLLFVAFSMQRASGVEGLGYFMSILIPLVILLLGHLPSLIYSNIEHKAMAEWLLHHLAKRAMNIMLDFTSLCDICQEYAMQPSISVVFIILVLSLTIAIEMIACNTGHHQLMTPWGDLLRVLDGAQVLITCAIYCSNVSPAGLFAGFIKATFQVLQFYWQ